nr:uncharacterized protein LOC109174707 [Ipomoea batatas]
MRKVTEELSERGSPRAATALSPEDEDLLRRSTKKTKRGRDLSKQPSTSPIDGIIQETPMSAGLKSPDSTQWRTPIETPNNAWGRKENYESTEQEEVSDEETMEEVAEMEEIVAGMEQVVAEEVKVKWQFEDISVETQVPSFVLDEMELMNSQRSQAVQNQAPPLSEFIYAQLPTESSTPNVITRSRKNYVTVATLQQSKAVQRETRKKRTTTKKK